MNKEQYKQLEKEWALLYYYTLRNHIGAMALKDSNEQFFYKILYKTLNENKGGK